MTIERRAAGRWFPLVLGALKCIPLTNSREHVTCPRIFRDARSRVLNRRDCSLPHRTSRLILEERDSGGRWGVHQKTANITNHCSRACPRARMCVREKHSVGVRRTEHMNRWLGGSCPNPSESIRHHRTTVPATSEHKSDIHGRRTTSTTREPKGRNYHALFSGLP